MTITYETLVAFINSLNSDGVLSKQDLNRIVSYIINGGLTKEINIQKSNNGGTF